MSRSVRIASQSGFYHVTMRGNARGVIFENDRHRIHYLELLNELRTKWKLRIIAWCLMDNHVHLVIDAYEVDLSEALHWLGTSYAVFFNHIEDRVGHVFQCPYGSKPIEYDNQLVNTVRYVHLNPQRAGICRAEQYRWSSYGEYVGTPVLVDPEPVFGACGGREQFFEASLDPDYVVRLPGPNYERGKDEVAAILHAELGDHAIRKLQNATIKERNHWIVALKARGLTNAQLARLCAVGERTIRRVLLAEYKRLEELQASGSRIACPKRTSPNGHANGHGRQT